MFPEIDLAQLPYLEIAHRSKLPECPAIYFAIDSENRVLYVGKANNLLARWRDHHRLEQLNRINRKTPIRLAWLNCSSDPGRLDETEVYFINYHQPLLNQTQVPAKKIIPAEVALQETLSKISKYVIIFGVVPGQDGKLPIVCIKYFGWAREVNNLRRIFQANNRKPTGLRWTETARRKYGAWWKASCSGVQLELGPWGDGRLQDSQPLREKALVQQLAGVDMLALREPELANEILTHPFLKENYPDIGVMEHDPIPLRWQRGFQSPKAKSSNPRQPGCVNGYSPKQARSPKAKSSEPRPLRSRPIQDF